MRAPAIAMMLCTAYTQNVRHLVGLLALLCSVGLAAADLESIGIVGDSVSTGALTGKGFTATSGALVGHTVRGHLEMAAPFATPGNTPVYDAYADPAAFNIRRPIWPPTRLWMSHGEPPDVSRPTGSDRLRMMIIDTEQYSWGYLLGRKLGVLPRHIYLAARHGSGARELQYQFAALQMRDPAMPAVTSGRGTCGPCTEKIARMVHKALEEKGIMNTLTSAAAPPGRASRR